MQKYFSFGKQETNDIFIIFYKSKLLFIQHFFNVIKSANPSLRKVLQILVQQQMR